MAHFGDLHQMAGFIGGERVDPIIGAPETLGGHHIECGHAGHEGNGPAGKAGDILVWEEDWGVPGKGGAERAGERGVECFEGIGDTLSVRFDLSGEDHFKVRRYDFAPLGVGRKLCTGGKSQTCEQETKTPHAISPLELM
jgi:hypothetical protein